jgi:hypothetical protein
MGSKKQQETTTQNSYGWQTPPDTGDVRALRDWQPEKDPTTPYTFGRMRQGQRDAFHNPYGAYTTPAIRDATLRASDMEIGQQESQANRQSQYDVNNQIYAKDALLAGATAPRLTQTGGNSTTTQSGGLLGDILGSAAQGAGSAAVM